MDKRTKLKADLLKLKPPPPLETPGKDVIFYIFYFKKYLKILRSKNFILIVLIVGQREKRGGGQSSWGDRKPQSKGVKCLFPWE